MEGWQSLMIIWSVTLTISIVWDYYFLIWRRILVSWKHMHDETANGTAKAYRWFAAGILHYGAVKWMWLVFVFLMCAAYVLIFLGVCLGSWNDGMHIFVIAYSLFLVSAAFYPRLVFGTFKLLKPTSESNGVVRTDGELRTYLAVARILMALDLVLMAVSGCMMPYGLSLNADMNAVEWASYISAIYLAAFTSIFDLALWGIPWIFFTAHTPDIYHSHHKGCFFESKMEDRASFFKNTRLNAEYRLLRA